MMKQIKQINKCAELVFKIQKNDEKQSRRFLNSDLQVSAEIKPILISCDKTTNQNSLSVFYDGWLIFHYQLVE